MRFVVYSLIFNQFTKAEGISLVSVSVKHVMRMLCVLHVRCYVSQPSTMV